MSISTVNGAEGVAWSSKVKRQVAIYRALFRSAHIYSDICLNPSGGLFGPFCRQVFLTLFITDLAYVHCVKFRLRFTQPARHKATMQPGDVPASTTKRNG